MAAAFALLLLPYSLVGPFAGAFIDHWRRRQVLLVADLVRAAMCIGLAAFVAAGSTGVAFTVLALALVGVNRFVLAALPAAQPHVVEVRDFVTGNALAPTLGSGATVVGALVGVGLRVSLGDTDGSAAWIVLAAAAMYAGASALCLRMGADLLGPDADAPRPDVSPIGTARALVDAARRIRADPSVMKALAALTSVRVAFGFWTVLTVVRERTLLHPVSDSDGALAALALATALGALGAVASALVTPSAVRHLGGRRWVVILLSVGGIGFLVTLPIVSTWAVLGVAALLGFVSQGVKVCVDTVLQRQIGDAWRGRVFAINDLLTNAAFVLAGLLAVPFA